MKFFVFLFVNVWCLNLLEYNFDNLVRFYFFLCLLYILSDPYYTFDQAPNLYRWNFRKELPVDTVGWNCNQSGCIVFQLPDNSETCNCFGMYLFNINELLFMCRFID
jgi:hypothetical protein